MVKVSVSPSQRLSSPVMEDKRVGGEIKSTVVESVQPFASVAFIV